MVYLKTYYLLFLTNYYYVDNFSYFVVLFRTGIDFSVEAKQFPYAST